LSSYSNYSKLAYVSISSNYRIFTNFSFKVFYIFVKLKSLKNKFKINFELQIVIKLYNVAKN